MRITLGMAREIVGDIPQANLSPGDDRAARLVNQAVEQIVIRSKSLVRRVRICLDNACVTLPREIASLTECALCASPIPIRNQWFEFDPDNSNVFVEQDYDGDVGIHDRGEVCCFKEITGTGKTLRVFTDKLENVGTYLWVYGQDQNLMPIRSVVDGVLRDGIRVHLANMNTQGIILNQEFSSVSVVQKDQTKGPVRLYEHNIATGTDIPIGIYEHDELIPSYKKYLVRGAGDAINSDQTTSLTAMGKLEFVKATDDRTVLVIGSEPALKLMMLGIVKTYQANRAKEGLALQDEAMHQMSLYRDHKSPVEQTTVRWRSFGTAKLSSKRVGQMR